MGKFVITEEHLKLMRKFYVGWCDDEYGAPQIDPKRPYGNSDVAIDIAEILDWETPNLYHDWDQAEYDALSARARKIHEETLTALQISLRLGHFRAGTYEEAHSGWEDWREA